MTKFATLLAAAASLAAISGGTAAVAAPVRNVVLVHGAFADGSGWKPVADILRKDGYHVSIVQEPLTSVEDDAAATKRVLDQQDGPAVLVGHSYGGAVITAAGDHPNVSALVYVAAFAPDQGETLGGLVQGTPPASNSIRPTKDGFLFINQADFDADFAGDLPKAEADFMAISQMPIAGKTFGEPFAAPAWKAKPSYGIVATGDRMINPQLERTMYARAHARITEVKGSHVIFISQPRAVATVIETAAHEAR
ncbi:MAG TPA: alpha/beta hydrolase [Sphingomonas sp.]